MQPWSVLVAQPWASTRPRRRPVYSVVAQYRDAPNRPSKGNLDSKCLSARDLVDFRPLSRMTLPRSSPAVHIGPAFSSLPKQQGCVPFLTACPCTSLDCLWQGTPLKLSHCCSLPKPVVAFDRSISAWVYMPRQIATRHPQKKSWSEQGCRARPCMHATVGQPDPV